MVLYHLDEVDFVSVYMYVFFFVCVSVFKSISVYFVSVSL